MLPVTQHVQLRTIEQLTLIESFCESTPSSEEKITQIQGFQLEDIFAEARIRFSVNQQSRRKSCRSINFGHF